MPVLVHEPLSQKLTHILEGLPASGQFFVSLRELGSPEALVLHPVGTLQISQRFAPRPVGGRVISTQGKGITSFGPVQPSAKFSATTCRTS